MQWTRIEDVQADLAPEDLFWVRGRWDQAWQAYVQGRSPSSSRGRTATFLFHHQAAFAQEESHSMGMSVRKLCRGAGSLAGPFHWIAWTSPAGDL